MSRQVKLSRNTAFSEFIKKEMYRLGVKSHEFEKACGINKGALNMIKKG